MKVFSVLCLLALFFPSVYSQDFVCNIFGGFGSRKEEQIGQALSAILEGMTSDFESPNNLVYSSLRIDEINTPDINGCTVTVPADITLVGANGNPNQPGVATIQGTFQWARLFLLEICVSGLEVKELDFDNSPGTFFEDFAKSYINGQLDDLECTPIFG